MKNKIKTTFNFFLFLTKYFLKFATLNLEIFFIISFTISSLFFSFLKIDLNSWLTNNILINKTIFSVFIIETILYATFIILTIKELNKKMFEIINKPLLFILIINIFYINLFNDYYSNFNKNIKIFYPYLLFFINNILGLSLILLPFIIGVIIALIYANKDELNNIREHTIKNSQYTFYIIIYATVYFLFKKNINDILYWYYILSISLSIIILVYNFYYFYKINKNYIIAKINIS